MSATATVLSNSNQSFVDPSVVGLQSRKVHTIDGVPIYSVSNPPTTGGKTLSWLADENNRTGVTGGIRNDAIEYSRCLSTHTINRAVSLASDPAPISNLFPVDTTPGWRKSVDYFVENDPTFDPEPHLVCCPGETPASVEDNLCLRSMAQETFAVSYSICVTDNFQSDLAGIDLEARLLAAALKAIRWIVSRVAIQGYGSIRGIMENPDLPAIILPAIGSNVSNSVLVEAFSQAFALLDPNEVYMNAGIEDAMALAMPGQYIRSFSRRPYNQYNSYSVLSQILKGGCNTCDDGIDPLGSISPVAAPHFYQTSPTGGSFGLLYMRDPSHSSFVWGVPMYVLSPVKCGYHYTVTILTHCGEVIFFKPRHAVKLFFGG